MVKMVRDTAAKGDLKLDRTAQRRLLPDPKFDFLIVGAGRGGISLIAALLDAHSDVEVGFELHAQECLMGKVLSGPGRDELHQRVNTFIAACNTEAQRSPCRLRGNRITTEQIFGLEDHNAANPKAQVDVFEVFFNVYFGQQKIIFILRDDRACFSSKVRRAGRSYESAAEQWRYSVQCFRFLRERHGNNLCIRFEDLLFEPRKTLQRVSDFLGIPYQEAMLAGVSNQKLSSQYQHGKLDTAKAAPIDLPPAHLESIQAELNYCGYIGAKRPMAD